jgi:hypothetical protein
VDAQQLADILHGKRKALLAAQTAKVPLGFTKPRAPRISGPKKVAANRKIRATSAAVVAARAVIVQRIAC